MTHQSGKARAEYVRHMFARIARRYDIANRWMTWGQDVRWRRMVLDLAGLPVGGRLLDIGTGTGDLALQAINRDSTIQPVAVDITVEMMLQGRSRTSGEVMQWVCADALELPFCSGMFDAVVSGYLLRNVSDIECALAEQHRVLKPGGRMVCLDTTPLPSDLWHLPARLYVRHVIPLLGRLISGDSSAYRYLPQSTERFMTADVLVKCLQEAGFKSVGFHRLMGGTMAIHWGER
jgi:demethylmenaquinone methyltransferase / 2-methoxy-6-polyprenyl-1,4-benzoquinol methylase